MSEGLCPQCREPLTAGAAFCEACGAAVMAATGGASAPGAPPQSDPLDERAPISAATRPARPAPAAVPAGPRPCAECGGEVGEDLYCTTCGAKAPSARDHFEEAPAVWVAGVCDRGVRHSRNEDAMALAASDTPGEHAVLVVCDGVSTSKDSDVASMAAVRAALEVLRAPLPAGLGVSESADAAADQVFTRAAAAANTAVIAHSDPSSPNPASCTFVAAVLAGALLRYAHLGDSRAYYLPDDGEGRQLTLDDSMAQMLMAGGMPRAEAESSPQAHSITRWLGTDAEGVVPTVGRTEVTAKGWILVCSDGLWNYASEPAALREQIRAVGSSDPLTITQALVEWAKAQGGHDNITAALARVEGGTADG